MRRLSVGLAVAGVIVNVELLDTKPLVLTVTVTVAGAVMRLAPTDPVNWLALPKVVPSVPPFHKMSELGVKPEPFTVRVNAAAPACVLVGLMLVSVGIAGVIVNVEPLDTVPFVLTATVTAPGVVMRLAPTDPIN